MNKAILRNHIQAVLQARRIRPYRLAKESGVDSSSLWKFLHKQDANLNTDSLFLLWPHIYGNQIPIPNIAASEAEAIDAMNPHKESA